MTMSNKMERFTQRARRVLSLAQEEAERMQHSHIGTEHLLLGLVRLPEGVAIDILKFKEVSIFFRNPFFICVHCGQYFSWHNGVNKPSRNRQEPIESVPRLVYNEGV